jgi:nucleoid-associated protein YgaU
MKKQKPQITRAQSHPSARPGRAQSHGSARPGLAFLTAFFAVTAAVYLVGCASNVARTVNVGAGEYYSEDEYDLLGNRAKSSYCNELQAEMTGSQTEFDRVTREIQDAKDLIQSIRRSIVPIEREVLQLESDIRTLEDDIADVKALPSEWHIRAGESLTIIAMQKNVYNDIDKWWRIFDANRIKIDDPYYIFPDTVLVIPRDWPTEGKPTIPEDLLDFIIVDEY